jgi:diacylglycerol kinase family enzyme
MKGKTVQLQFSAPLAYHVDGEAMEPEHQFLIHLNPGSLRLLVPQGRAKNI